MGGTGELEPRPVLKGLNPRFTTFRDHPNDPVLVVDLQPAHKDNPVGHLYIPRNKVQPRLLHKSKWDRLWR